VNPKNQVHLEVERNDLPGSSSAFVVHTPCGGMVLEGYGSFWSPEKKAMVLRVDLKGFLSEGLSRNPPLEP
jgi:hypothetical protein